jgi:hypothetical protein
MRRPLPSHRLGTLRSSTKEPVVPDPRLLEAVDLLDRFADRTGVTSSDPPRRYLWTDAFAVMTDLGLYERTGDSRFRSRALELIDRVHRVLGRHRDDDRREGWLSGLDDAEAERHPTLGGLRIGKERPERGRHDPFDPQEEWERDGQYFHYLTRWMQALDRAARTTGDLRYARWSRELCETAVRSFGRHDTPFGRPALVWKMSIDLSRPLVPSTGQHDPLDGHVTARQLEATRHALGDDPEAPTLTAIAEQLRDMIDVRGLATTDPLGIGGLLLDLAHLDQVDPDDPLNADLLSSARAGLVIGPRRLGLAGPAETRLAFREFGLSIGLAAVEDRFPALADFVPLRETIESFWRSPEAQDSRSWRAHEDIDAVMLAASLVPRGVVELPTPTTRR